jgi:hypothetical protein
MKKRILLITCSSILILILLLIGIKFYYKYKFNKSIHQPILETLESIRNFSNNVSGIILLPKDSVHHIFTKQFFDNGSIFVFDNNKKILTNNYSNYNGICYSLIESKLCSDGSINNNENLLFGQTWLFDSLIKSVIFLNADSALLNETYDLIIVYGWSKYFSITYDNHRKEFYQCMISKKNMKVLFLAVNNDYTELFWNKNTPIPFSNNSLF